MTHPKITPILLMLLALLSTIAKSAENSPPNILFIAIDDLKAIGSIYSEEKGDFLQKIYPDETLRKEVAARMTPNIQRLADEGVAFMRAYCASPACNPSRAALMTGIRPHVSGLTTNAGAVFFREYEYQGQRPLENATTIAELLKNNGWYTGATGKIFHSGNNFDLSDGNRSWTDWTNVGGTAGSKTRSQWSPDSLDWGQEGNASAPSTSLNDYRTADFIARVLENGSATNNGTTFELPADKPFFLACGIFRPHLPFYATKDLLDLFPVEEMTVTRALLEEFTQDGDDVPEFAFGWSGLNRNQNGDPIIGSDRFVDILNHGNGIQANDGDLEGWKDMLKHYFASSAIADRAVGRLLDGLANSSYADNTIVVLWSDHGYHLGEKLHETKFTLWDDGARVNFLIKDPRNPQSAGIRCYRPVTLIDIYPTLANIAGLPLPDPRITGHDLGKLLKNPQHPWNIPAHTTYQTVENNMVRMERYKLIRYQNNNDIMELYDMDDDPDEYHNLADNPTHADAQAEMLNILSIALQEGTFPDEFAMSIQNWKYGIWGSSDDLDQRGLEDDPDLDGRSNFLEFALGLDPLTKDSSEGPGFPIAPVFEYTLPVWANQNDAHYIVQTSSDLSAWEIAWDSQTDQVSSDLDHQLPNGMTLLKLPAFEEGATRSFLRWEVE